MTEPVSDSAPQLPPELVRALERVPEAAVKLAVTGGLDSGKSAVAAAVRDALRANAIQVRTHPAGDSAAGVAYVVDDADQLSDAELDALTALAGDPARTVVATAQPRRHRRALLELLETLGREQTPMKLSARPDPDPAVLAARLRGFDDGLLDTLAVLSLDDGLGPADIVAALGVSAEQAGDLVDRAYATGLLDPEVTRALRAAVHEAVARAIGAVRHREIETALLRSQLAADTLAVRLALNLAEHGMRDAELAQRLSAAGAAAADPSAAARLYRAALRAGTGTPTDPLPLADALALAGDCSAAGAVADELLASTDPVLRAAAVRIAAAIACHDGNTAQAAELFDWLVGATPGHDAAFVDPQTAAAAAVVAIGAGDLPAARRAVRAPAVGPPTTTARSARKLAEGLLQTIEVPDQPSVALAHLGQALGPSPTVAVPDDAASLLALAALHAGDPVRARSVLGRVRRDEADRPAETLFANRHRLLHAWTLMVDGQLSAASAAAVDGSGLHPRDGLWAAALHTGLARRSGDTGALHRHWHAGMEVLAEYSVDLYSLLPLGELWVAAARMHQRERLRAPLETAFGLLANLGDPPAWSLPLHWAGVHAAILANAPESMAPHGAALTAAATRSDFARVLAGAGRAWLRVLAGQVDPDEVAGAARGLARFGLTWDATRLTGQAALQTSDARVSALMLALARDLKLTAGPVEDFADPVTSESEPGSPETPIARSTPARSGAALSAREREVAELLVLGMPYRDIGAQLFISAKTVEHHVARIRRRLGAQSRTEMLSMLRAMLTPQP